MLPKGHGEYVANSAVARFYLMEAVESEEKATENREHQWLILDEAKKKASFEETQNLLVEAENLRVKLEKAAKSSL